MKNLILFLLSITLLSSCVTRNRCNKLYPPEVYKKDSLSSISTQTNSIIIRDTIIHDTIKLKGDLITLHDTLPCPGLNYTKKEKKNRITTEINIKNGVIDVTCKEDSIIQAHSIEVTKYKTIIDKQKDFISRSINTESKVKTIYETPWYDYFLFGLLIAVILYVLVKKK